MSALCLSYLDSVGSAHGELASYIDTYRYFRKFSHVGLQPLLWIGVANR